MQWEPEYGCGNVAAYSKAVCRAVWQKGEVVNAILNTNSKTGFPFSQYSTNIQVSPDYCSLICLS